MLSKDATILDPDTFLEITLSEDFLYAVREEAKDSNKKITHVKYTKDRHGNDKQLWPGNAREQAIAQKGFLVYLDRVNFPRDRKYRKDANDTFRILRDLYIRDKIHRMNSTLMYTEYKALYLRYAEQRKGNQALKVIKYLYTLFEQMMKMLLRLNKQHVIHDIRDLFIDQTKNIEKVEKYMLDVMKPNTLGKEIIPKVVIRKKSHHKKKVKDLPKTFVVRHS